MYVCVCVWMANFDFLQYHGAADWDNDDGYTRLSLVGTRNAWVSNNTEWTNNCKSWIMTLGVSHKMHSLHAHTQATFTVSIRHAEVILPLGEMIFANFYRNQIANRSLAIDCTHTHSIACGLSGLPFLAMAICLCAVCFLDTVQFLPTIYRYLTFDQAKSMTDLWQ